MLFTYPMFSAEQVRLFEIVKREADRCQTKVFLVGGFVRDLLLGSDLSAVDVDFVVEGKIAPLLNGIVDSIGGELSDFPSFFTAKIVQPDQFSEIKEIDFASARQEIYPFPGSLPEVSRADLQTDLRRRDFSVNALALPLDSLMSWIAVENRDRGLLREQILDLFGGLLDLENKIIRVLHDRSFLDDPTRIFRACRYAIRISGKLGEKTSALMTTAIAAGALESIDRYRILKELKKIFREQKVALIIKELASYGVFSELALFDTNRIEEVSEALQLLTTLGVRQQTDFWFKIGFRIFAYHHDHASEVLTAFGFSRKKVQEIMDDLEVVKTKAFTAESSPEATVLGLLLSGGKDPDLRDRAVQKGLLGNDH